MHLTLTDLAALLSVLLSICTVFNIVAHRAYIGTTRRLQRYRFTSSADTTDVVESRVSPGFSDGAKALENLEYRYRKSSGETGKLALALEMIWNCRRSKDSCDLEST